MLNIYVKGYNMNLYEAKIVRMLNEELSKNEVQTMISSKISSSYGSKEFKQEVKEIAAKVVEELFKTLWQKKNFWKSDVTR